MSATWTRIVSTCIALGLSGTPAHALRITEFLATNTATNTDEDGEFSDWLEVLNEGGAPVDLTGYYLTDDATLLTKWQFPSVTLPAGGYLLVWASDKNRTTPGLPLHTNFKLSASGEYLGLVRPDGTTIEHEYAPAFPPQIADVSFGLASDGSTQRCFLTPTPAAANDESVACGFTADVQFDVPHGMYDAPFALTLSSLTPGATIRYTLDGTTPTPTVGTVYAGPIPITTTAVVRAIATSPGLAPSKTATRTYIFLNDVVHQSAATIPPGYPSTWGNGVSADYDMDPDVVNDPRYAPTIRDDLKAIPTVSIVTDIDHLFGATNGIYTHTGGRGDAWERPASIEMIFPDGSDGGFQKNGGIRIQGQTSRNPSVRKHSMSLRFRSSYDGPLTYGFFDAAVIQDGPADSFGEIRLFAAHQNSWHSSFGGNPSHAQYTREIYARDTLTDMGQRSSHGLSVQVYLNGIYWGMYQATENVDADFMASYFGGTDADYDVYKDNNLEDGNSAARDALDALLAADLTSYANYQAALQYVDATELVDYVLMNFYIANVDWSSHNWVIGRKREPGAGFKFFAWDSELSLGGVQQNNLDVNGPLGFYGRLMTSPEFRMLLADRIHRHLFDGGALTPARAAARYEKRTDEIDRAVVGESARWGDRLRPTDPFTRDDEWLVEKFRLLLEFFPARTGILLDQLRGRGFYPATDAPTFNQLGGSFFPGFALTMTAPSGAIYYTTDGSDPRLPGGAVSPSALAYGGPVILATSVHVLARALAGSTWSALTDASFVRETPIRVTELMYNATGGSNFDFLELRNIGPSPVDLVGLKFSVGIDFTFPSFVVASGGQALIVKNAASFDTLYGAGKPVVGVYSGNLSDGGEELRLDDPDGNPIQDFTYADSWYPTTDGGGYSLVIRDPLADKSVWSLASGWRASTFVNGSAGAAEAPFCSDGVDNDGDTLVDLADPGCASASQNTESPECNDGADNDGDTAIDLADPDCAAPSDASESPAADDGSLCYRVRPFAGGSAFGNASADLSDVFESDVHFNLITPLALCLSGSLNGGPVHDGATHLEAYKIREAPGEPQHVRRTGLDVETALGPLSIDTVRPDRLLVPTAKDTAGPVTAPDPATHEVDNYKCYQIKVTPKTPKYFPRLAQANFADDFEHRDYAVKKPKLFCTPVDVEGGGIKNPAGYLLCYSAKKGRFAPAHTRRVGVYTANAFGPGRFDTLTEGHLCVPTRLVSP